MTDPIYTPGQPYLQVIPGGFSPGKIAHLTGAFAPTATALVLKIQSGSFGDPNDEIGLCIYARINEGIFGMNAFTRAAGWGQEETLPVQGFIRGQSFELTILCDPYYFKVALNGQHFGEFSHRLNPASLTHFNIVSGSNDVTIHCIWIEDPSRGQMAPPVGQAPYAAAAAAGGYSPYPPQVEQQQYSPQHSGFSTTSHSNGKGGKGLLGMVGSAGAAVAGALGASHLLGKSKGYPGGHSGGFPGQQPQYGGGYPGQQPQYGGGYPGQQPHYEGHKGGGGGLLNKAMGIGGGILGAKAMK